LIYLLPHTIFASAERLPDKEAFKCGRDSLTYAETATKARQLASALWKFGVRRGDRVGVYLNRSIETVIAVHGIMHAGAVFVPLDPKSPAERIQFQIEDCGIEVIVTNASQQKNLAGTQVQGTLVKHIIGLNTPLEDVNNSSWADIFTEQGGFNPPINQLETDLAYIMYTSGSTGQPKGIMHTHASGLAFARLFAATYGLTADDRLGGHAPIYFDMSTPALFVAPLVGASAVIVSDGHTIFPASMSGLLEAEKITAWYSVPLALTQMLQSQSLTDRDLTSLRWVIYAGEPFAPKYLRELMNIAPDCRFSNAYGPAETNVCTYYNIPAPPEGDKNISIGNVWGNTDFLLLDAEGETVADDAPAELLIRSTTMMAGYWGRPDLTERAFHQITGPGGLTEVFYRTGDLVQQDETGNLHFVGRKDNQVKVRGYRVELDAIEARLLAHPAVAEAVVLAIPDKDSTLQLNAVLILQPEGELTGKDLKAFAAEKLTWYAIPEQIHFVTELPRTGSGKVSRPALRDEIVGRSGNDAT
jgi:amino acid adenylation domain-containing protein